MKESAIDSIIVNYSGVKSVNEIAEITGYSPDQVEQRRKEIFDQVELNQQQLWAKMMFQLQEMIAEMHKRLPGASDEDAARLGNTSAGGIGRLSKMVADLEALKRRDNSERDAVYARQMVMLMEMAAFGLIEWVTQEYPQVEQETAKAKFKELLHGAILEIEAR